MKPINLKSENAIEKLTEEIKLAEGRATARTITAEKIIDMVEKIDKYLGIAKSKMIGITVSCDLNAQKFPNAYHYIPSSTWFAAEYRRSGWYVTDIYRGISRQSSRSCCMIGLTDEAKQAILARYHNML